MNEVSCPNCGRYCIDGGEKTKCWACGAVLHPEQSEPDVA